MSSPSQTAAADAPKAAPRAYAHYVLFLLCFANVLNVADRNMMGILLEPIKQDLRASDTAMSLLTGASFVVFYSVFGIPIARWADRGDRRGILALGVAVWSLMTAFCGLAGSFTQMALARAGVGVGESSGAPTSISLIADYYERAARPQMIAFFNLATPLGGVLTGPLVALLMAHGGWRFAFLALGAPGVLLALLIWLTVAEPKRGALDDTPAAAPTGSLKQALKAMFGSRVFTLLMLGTAVAGLGAGTLGAWGPAMMMRQFHVSASAVASISSPLIALAGVVGTLLGGWFNSHAARRDPSNYWLVLAPALVSLTTIPAGVLYVFAPSWAWMTIAGMVGIGTIAFRTSPYLALCLDLVPADCRGLAAAASLVATSLVGQAGGPLVVGMISDALTPKVGPVEALRTSFLFAPITLAIGVVPFFMALKTVRAESERR